MGICASAHMTERRRGGRLIMRTPAAAMVVHVTSCALQEFRRPVKAADVLAENPNCFLSNSEAMNVDSEMPRVAKDEDLQLGQLYFLLPLSVSSSHAPLSLQDMCALAIKASAALNDYYSPVTGADFRRGSFDERVSGGCGNVNRIGDHCNKNVELCN